MHPPGGQSSSHVVLGTQWVRSGQGDLCTACFQSDEKVGRLDGHVEAGHYPHSFQGLCSLVLVSDGLENGHVAPGPFDPPLTLFCQV